MVYWWFNVGSNFIKMKSPKELAEEVVSNFKLIVKSLKPYEVPDGKPPENPNEYAISLIANDLYRYGQERYEEGQKSVNDLALKYKEEISRLVLTLNECLKDKEDYKYKFQAESFSKGKREGLLEAAEIVKPFTRENVNYPQDPSIAEVILGAIRSKIEKDEKLKQS